jgi:DNA-binding LytR/AlgR family response regulator
LPTFPEPLHKILSPAWKEKQGIRENRVVRVGAVVPYFGQPQQKLEPTSLFIRKNDRHHRVLIQDIQYICAAGSYLEIVTKSETFSLSQNLSQFERRNIIASLVRVHRSYIVNLAWVGSFDARHIYIGDKIIPIGAGYREKLLRGLQCI